MSSIEGEPFKKDRSPLEGEFLGERFLLSEEVRRERENGRKIEIIRRYLLSLLFNTITYQRIRRVEDGFSIFKEDIMYESDPIADLSSIGPFSSIKIRYISINIEKEKFSRGREGVKTSVSTTASFSLDELATKPGQNLVINSISSVVKVSSSLREKERSVTEKFYRFSRAIDKEKKVPIFFLNSYDESEGGVCQEEFVIEAAERDLFSLKMRSQDNNITTVVSINDKDSTSVWERYNDEGKLIEKITQQHNPYSIITAEGFWQIYDPTENSTSTGLIEIEYERNKSRPKISIGINNSLYIKEEGERIKPKRSEILQFILDRKKRRLTYLSCFLKGENVDIFDQEKTARFQILKLRPKITGRIQKIQEMKNIKRTVRPQ